MDKQSITYIVLQPSRSSATYSERETMEACHLGIGALRHLHALGLIQGEQASGQQRYSAGEIARLRQIRRLRYDLGVNLAGVEVILHLLEHLEAAHQGLEQE